MLGAYVTLGVMYRTKHQPAFAEQVLARVAAREPDKVYAMSNRVLVLRDLGSSAEADSLAQRLDVLDPHPPFSYFGHVMACAARGDARTRSRNLFVKDVARASYRHEFEYWLAVSFLTRNDAECATVHAAPVRWK